VVGVQFHPESAASEHGYAILDRFLHSEGSRLGTLPPRADGMALRPERPLLPWGQPRRATSDPEDAFVPPPVERVR
jgi:hypothetical protein